MLQEQERREREELRQKRVAKRQRVIEEIIQTEQDYLNSLHLVMRVFLAADSEKVKNRWNWEDLIYRYCRPQRPPASAAPARRGKSAGGAVQAFDTGLFTPRLAALALDEIAALCLLPWPTQLH